MKKVSLSSTMFNIIFFPFPCQAPWRLPFPSEGSLQGCPQLCPQVYLQVFLLVCPLLHLSQTTCLRRNYKRKVCWLSTFLHFCGSVLGLKILLPGETRLTDFNWTTLQHANGNSYRLSATQKRGSLDLWMPRRKICHLSMFARSSGTMEI